MQDLSTEYLDNVSVKDLVTSEGDHIIGGSTAFTRLMAQTVTLSPRGTVGDIDLSEEVVILNDNAILGMFFFYFVCF